MQTSTHFRELAVFAATILHAENTARVEVWDSCDSIRTATSCCCATKWAEAAHALKDLSNVVCCMRLCIRCTSPRLRHLEHTTCLHAAHVPNSVRFVRRVSIHILFCRSSLSSPACCRQLLNACTSDGITRPAMLEISQAKTQNQHYTSVQDSLTDLSKEASNKSYNKAGNHPKQSACHVIVACLGSGPMHVLNK